jgi:hypothetical protein
LGVQFDPGGLIAFIRRAGRVRLRVVFLASSSVYRAVAGCCGREELGPKGVCGEEFRFCGIVHTTALCTLIVTDPHSLILN